MFNEPHATQSSICYYPLCLAKNTSIFLAAAKAQLPLKNEVNRPDLGGAELYLGKLIMPAALLGHRGVTDAKTSKKSNSTVLIQNHFAQ